MMQYPHLGLQAQFLKNAVPSYRTHIIYHRVRLALTLLQHSSASARPLAKADNSRAVTSLSNREISSQIKPVARRIGRVAKQYCLPSNIHSLTEGSLSYQKQAISKKGFSKCFLTAPINNTES